MLTATNPRPIEVIYRGQSPKNTVISFQDPLELYVVLGGSEGD